MTQDDKNSRPKPVTELHTLTGVVEASPEKDYDFKSWQLKSGTKISEKELVDLGWRDTRLSIGENPIEAKVYELGGKILFYNPSSNNVSYFRFNMEQNKINPLLTELNAGMKITPEELFAQGYKPIGTGTIGKSLGAYENENTQILYNYPDGKIETKRCARSAN